MRVTSSMMMRSTLRDLSQGSSRMQETQQQITSNRQLTRSVCRTPARPRRRWGCVRTSVAPISDCVR